MKENNIKKNQNSNNISSTHYIKIDAKNILQEQESDTLNQMLMELVNSILVENMGKEINKFFVKILPENKEVDILKFNYSLAAKIKKKFNLNKNEILSRCELYMDYLINYKIDTSSPFSLTNEINDKLSLILAIIYRNIKQNGKFLNFEDVKKCASESSDNNNILLDAFQSKSSLNTNSSISAYMYSVDNFTDESDILDSNIRSTVSPFMSNKMSLEPRMSYRIPSKKDDIMNLNENNNNKNNNTKIIVKNTNQNNKIAKIQSKNKNIGFNKKNSISNEKESSVEKKNNKSIINKIELGHDYFPNKEKSKYNPNNNPFNGEMLEKFTEPNENYELKEIVLKFKLTEEEYKLLLKEKAKLINPIGNKYNKKIKYNY